MDIDTDNPTAKFELKFDDEVVTIVVEFHFSDNADDFIDVAHYVEAASYLLLKGMG
jgi:hypothetical protein